MRVRRVAKRLWDVLAIEGDDGHCYVLEFLAHVPPSQRKHAIRILSLLREIVPGSGPPRREPHSKQLRPNLYEFRRVPKRGPGLRVLWFEHAGKVVVCTHGVLKDQAKLDKEDIAWALEMRARYFEATANRNLTIVDAEE